MSFSSDTKGELARVEPEKKCCMLAEIAGFIRVSGSVKLAGGGKMELIVATENPAVARHYKKLIKEYFDVDATLGISEGSAIKKADNIYFHFQIRKVRKLNRYCERQEY